MRRLFRRARADDRGAALALVAGSLVVLMGMAAFGSDLAWFYLNASRIQRAADAAALGIDQNRPVVVRNGTHQLTLSAAMTDAVAPGSVFLPLYYDGGVVNQLLPANGTPVTVTVSPA